MGHSNNLDTIHLAFHIENDREKIKKKVENKINKNGQNKI